MQNRQATRRKVARHVAQASHAVENAATTLTDNLHEMGDSATDLASRYYRDGRRALRDTAKSVEHTIAERPIRAMMVTLGIGFLLGAYLIRR